MGTSLVRILTLSAVILASAACYNHRPVPLEAVPPNGDVRLVVTRAGANEVAEVREVPGAAPTIRGKFMGRDGGDLLLRIPVGQRTVGFLSSDIEQTVRVPELEVLQVEQRELDGVRTGLFIAGIAGATTLVLFAIVDAVGGSMTLGDDPPQLENRIPLISIPIGR